MNTKKKIDITPLFDFRMEEEKETSKKMKEGRNDRSKYGKECVCMYTQSEDRQGQREENILVVEADITRNRALKERRETGE